MSQFKTPVTISLHFIAATSTLMSFFAVYGYFQSSYYEYNTFLVSLLSVCLTSWMCLYFSYESTKRKVFSLVNKFQCDKFKPNKNLVFFDKLSGKYIGIDDKNGTILLISLNEKNRPLLIGKNHKDWLGYELHDCKLILKFKDFSHPTFILNSNAKIKVFCHKLDVLLSKSYRPQHETGNEFARFVEQKAFA